MKRVDLIARGERNLADAAFVRRTFIPIAMDASRWSIAVFEAFRVVELVIKGMICLSGHAHREVHDLGTILDRFVRILSRTRAPLPFLFGLEAPNGDGYGVLFAQGCVLLQKRIGGYYTSLGSSGAAKWSTDDLLRLRLDVDGSVISVVHEGTVLMSISDASVHDPVRMSRAFIKSPDSERIARLKLAAESLRQMREDAFFALRPHTKVDAEEATARMHDALEAAAVFVEHQ